MAFQQRLRSELLALVRPSADTANTNSGGGGETWVFPTVQLGACGLRHDEDVTVKLLSSAKKGGKLRLASAYLNLPPAYERALAQCEADVEILTAGPNSHGTFSFFLFF